MQLEDRKLQALDEVVTDYLAELRRGGEERAAVTLAYTHSLHRFWRQVLRMLPMPARGTVLDVGSGLGLLAFELAAHAPVWVEGIDVEPGFVAHSRVLQERLAGAGLFVEGARVDFSVGDAGAVEFDERSFDLVFVREVFQFLSDPTRAAAEVFRVLRPGGFTCVSDMDDQLRLTWPAPSPALERLVAAVAQMQHGRGGDRYVGRKLSSYLRAGGLRINSLVVLPEAQHRLVDARDSERALTIEQLHDARSRVLDAEVMPAEEFDAALAELEAEEPFEEFRMHARIVVLAQRPEA